MRSLPFLTFRLGFSYFLVSALYLPQSRFRTLRTAISSHFARFLLRGRETSHWATLISIPLHRLMLEIHIHPLRPSTIECAPFGIVSDVSQYRHRDLVASPPYRARSPFWMFGCEALTIYPFLYWRCFRPHHRYSFHRHGIHTSHTSDGGHFSKKKLSFGLSKYPLNIAFKKIGFPHKMQLSN